MESKDRDMIIQPGRWPLLYLPLKRRVEGGWPEIATLMTATYDDTAELMIRINWSVMGPVSGDVTEKTFKNVDELLADGWVVD